MLSQLSQQQFLLDENLSPSVATALQAVGYRVNTVFDIFGRRGVKDPEIIDWCSKNGVVWIHADDSARRDHARAIVTSRISTVWIPRSKLGLSIKDQLGRLAHKLQTIEHKVNLSNKPVHLVLSASGIAHEPKVTLKDVTSDQNRKA